MKNLITIILLLLIFILPTATSLLLDLQFIQAYTSRQIIVYALMITESVVVILMLINFLKSVK